MSETDMQATVSLFSSITMLTGTLGGQTQDHLECEGGLDGREDERRRL